MILRLCTRTSPSSGLSSDNIEAVKFVVLLYAQASLEISFCIPTTSPGTGRRNAAAAATAAGSPSFKFSSQSDGRAQRRLLRLYPDGLLDQEECVPPHKHLGSGKKGLDVLSLHKITQPFGSVYPEDHFTLIVELQ